MKAFESPQGPQMEAFLTLQRAAGRKYRAVEEELRRFDHFAARRPSLAAVVTPDLAHAWLSSRPHLSPATQRSRVSVLRLFCLYLSRFDDKAYVPERSLYPARIPEKKPYVYSAEELQMIFKWALSLSTRGWWFRPQSVHALIALLYGTGLRIGEACRLRVGDVDLPARTVLVRDTKFFKSRIVPFSQSLGETLNAYFAVRKTLTSEGKAGPFFVNRLLRPVSPVKFSWLFHRMLRSAGIGRSARGRAPRLHDVRRTFAVHRLIRWYGEGADLWAKLPLLSTYMGHSNVLATHVYLTATAELLEKASDRFERTFGQLLAARGEG
jgi:site-specific recombinase XerD